MTKRYEFEATDNSHLDMVATVNVFAECEGWAIFNENEIQRDDEMGIFPDDDAAILWVREMADRGSSLHRTALDLTSKE